MDALDKFMPKRTETVTYLRMMKSSEMEALTEPILIRRHPDEPVVVLMPFNLFMEMQKMVFDLEKQIQSLAEEAVGSAQDKAEQMRVG